MSRSPVLVLVVAVLALAGAAGAKGPVPDRICGASGCAPLTEQAASALGDALGTPFQMVAAPRPEPYYVIRLRRFSRRDPVPRPWIFAAGAVRIATPGERPYWRTLPTRASSALRRAAAGLAAFPASASWPTNAPSPARTSSTSPAAAMLGVSYRRASGALAWFDPLTLAPLPGRKAALANHLSTWAFSADRSTVAFGSWNLPELRFVDARAMRVVGDLRLLRGAGRVERLFWLRTDRLLALVDDEPSQHLVVVDPRARRVVRIVALPRVVWDTARLGDQLVLLFGSVQAFDPAQVAVASADGDLRTTTVDQIRIGTVVDDQSADYRARTMSPGFAVDPDGRRAFLIAADSTAAEIDLDTLAVRYHELDRPSLFGRVARWLVPAAQAKEVEGPTRAASWLGSGLIALTGADYSLVKGADGSEHQVARPAGLRLVDTSTWRARELDPDASEALPTAGVVLAMGGSYDSAEAAADARGIGIVAYGLDGRVRWRLHPGERRWLSPVGGLGYVYLDEKRMEVVDLATGRVVESLNRAGDPWPLLLAG